jgi:inner membrane protein
MDNLTHSLIGAALGQAGLKRKTGLAMPALIIAANLPDIDAACFFWLNGTEHLGFRRGITHGPPAMVLLPLLLAGALWGYDRWQTQRGKRPEDRLPVSFTWLFLLSLIGCLSHPLFDWFNNYGVRFLEPFSSTWFYGDVLFIIDPWIVALLGGGLWLSKKRERAGAISWHRPASTALIIMAAYIAINLGISRMASALPAYSGMSAKVANPVPFAFWRREVLWRKSGQLANPREPESYGSYNYSLFGGAERPSVVKAGYTNMADLRIAKWAKGDPQAEAFLFWSRMPVAEVGPKGILLTDQRFMDNPARSSFTIELKPR